MRVRMATSIAGVGWDLSFGDEVEVAQALGEALCADGRAEDVTPERADGESATAHRKRVAAGGRTLETAATEHRMPRAGG